MTQQVDVNTVDVGERRGEGRGISLTRIIIDNPSGNVSGQRLLQYTCSVDETSSPPSMTVL